MASAAVLRINERINVRAMEQKVCAQNEAVHFPALFFGDQDIQGQDRRDARIKNTYQNWTYDLNVVNDFKCSICII